MKKTVIGVSMALGLILSGAIDLYPETAKVVSVDSKSDLVTVQTFNGNQFAFYGVEDYMENDMVSMLMYGNNTAEVEDDEILMVKYSGYIEK